MGTVELVRRMEGTMPLLVYALSFSTNYPFPFISLFSPFQATAIDLFEGVLTKEFLDFSASRGNNLRSIGLEPGCKWCLCTARWKEAVDAAKGPKDPVVPQYARLFFLACFGPDHALLGRLLADDMTESSFTQQMNQR